MTEEKDGTQKSGLKPAQVIASALAAITAAFLGATLGVAGTVVGAGIASIITTVGGEVYLRSLRRTREAARKTASVLTDTRLRQETRHVEPPASAPANPLVRRRPEPTAAFDPNRTQHLDPHRTQQLDPQRTRQLAGAGQIGDQRTVFIPRPDQQDPKPKTAWWKNRWTLIAGTSVAAFVIGMLTLTGFEKVTGHAVSGGAGTTFGQVVGRSNNGTPATTTRETTTVTHTPSSRSRTSAPSSSEQKQPQVSETPTQEAPPSSSAAQPTQSPVQQTQSASPSPSG
ncbi:hypothetical protein [Amycolatopsis pithecellobii]|uniref:hypothetical protein n=1 Tax=Amycolatopsis pithecellobii TaxID=664692 RepID=UPI001FEAB30A|nr:hypothetical protein [Amycolatopsis pithecellobii]